MPRPYSAAPVDVAIELPGTLTEIESRFATPRQADPFHILILGDFSGRSRERDESEAVEPEPIEVNRDNLDAVLAQLQAAVNLTFPDARPVDLEFRRIEDFEPDRIYERVEQFQQELTIENPFPEYATWMRAILHHPDFQALEAAWRGLDLLLWRLEDDPLLKLYILDLTKAEVAQDVTSPGELQASKLYRALVQQTVATPGANLWAVVVGNYGFDQSAGDAALLDRLALLSRFATAPFIAGGELTSNEPSDDWQALRNSTNAKYLGLALPRVLLRQPYGADTVPCESFEFEEIQGEPKPAQYLWGNPALLCALLLAQSFSKYGWRFRPGIMHQITGLPVHTYEIAGETRTQDCVETPLAEDEIEPLLNRGYIPLVCSKSCDAVRVVRFQSIAEPLSVLSGRWS